MFTLIRGSKRVAFSTNDLKATEGIQLIQGWIRPMHC